MVCINDDLATVVPTWVSRMSGSLAEKIGLGSINLGAIRILECVHFHLGIRFFVFLNSRLIRPHGFHHIVYATLDLVPRTCTLYFNITLVAYYYKLMMSPPCVKAFPRGYILRQQAANHHAVSPTLGAKLPVPNLQCPPSSAWPLRPVGSTKIKK